MATQSGNSNSSVKIVDPVDAYTALIVRGAIVGTGLLGLTLYVKNSRLFAKFQHVNRIPKEFFVKERELKGLVREVTPYGLIKVEHLPIISLPHLFFRRRPLKNIGLLNLRLAGLDVSPPGLTYLTKDVRLIDKPVSFTVIKKVEGNSDALDADVTLKKKFLTRQNLNVDLVRKGFARIPSAANEEHVKALQENASYSRLITRLLTSEKVAERRGVGRWERSSWVESIKSLPAAFAEMVRISPFTKFIVLSYNVLQDLLYFTVQLLTQVYYLVRAIVGYSVIGYRNLSNGVDRLVHFYDVQKGRIKSLGRRKIEPPKK